MTILKNKIKIVSTETNKNSYGTLISICIIIILLGFGSYIYLNYKKEKININTIVGKKIYITECNTKDYLIIGKDSSYTLEITNEKCEQFHFEGIIKIKKNKIIFTKSINGFVDKNNNIIINNKTFEREE